MSSSVHLPMYFDLHREYVRDELPLLRMRARHGSLFSSLFSPSPLFFFFSIFFFFSVFLKRIIIFALCCVFRVPRRI